MGTETSRCVAIVSVRSGRENVDELRAARALVLIRPRFLLCPRNPPPRPGDGYVFFPTRVLTQVALATGAACILGVSAIVMGVLVLAVGTSVPDMIGSMIAAKNGEASVRAPL